jgi:hypothetical protein
MPGHFALRNGAARLEEILWSSSGLAVPAEGKIIPRWAATLIIRFYRGMAPWAKIFNRSRQLASAGTGVYTSARTCELPDRLFLAHVLVGEPESTSPEHAPTIE